MPIKVKVNLQGLNQRFSEENILRARKKMATQAQQEMNVYVPSSTKGKKENGTTLRGEVVIASDGSTVTYNVPYARAQFYGFITNKYGGPYRIHNYTTHGTSRRWDLRMKANKEAMDRVKNAVGEELWDKQN